jgi:Protein of unknown function (DUF1217)
MDMAVSGYTLFKTLTPANMAAGQARLAKSGVVKADIDYFRANIGKVKTPDEFLKDYRLLKFALTAYQMEDQLNYPARIKQILKDNPNDSASLVNRMTNATYKTMNADFNFFRGGVAKLSDKAFIDQLVSKYASAQYQTTVSNGNSNVADALYFRDKIGSISNTYQIIGDAVLFGVVKTALNIPNAAVTGDVKRLKQWIEGKLDMKKLKDSTYVGKLLDRFLVLKDVETRKASGGGLLDMFA